MHGLRLGLCLLLHELAERCGKQTHDELQMNVLCSILAYFGCELLLTGIKAESLLDDSLTDHLFIAKSKADHV